MVPGILDLSRFPNKLGLSRSFIEEEGEGEGARCRRLYLEVMKGSKYTYATFRLNSVSIHRRIQDFVRGARPSWPPWIRA